MSDRTDSYRSLGEGWNCWGHEDYERSDGARVWANMRGDWSAASVSRKITRHPTPESAMEALDREYPMEEK